MCTVCARASEFITELIISSKGESVNVLDSSQSPLPAAESHTCLLVSDLSLESYTCLLVSHLSNGLRLRPVLPAADLYFFTLYEALVPKENISKLSSKSKDSDGVGLLQ